MAALAKFVPKRYLLNVTDLRRTVRSWQYRGDAVECPCCEGRFQTFLPFGLQSRPNAICPRCGALERDRLLSLYFERRTNLYTGRLRVLHFAPEHWLQKKLRTLPATDYTSADLYSPNAMVKMDITDIRFPDRSFDVVICNHVLEHIPDDRKAMGELFRVLKVGGWAVLQVPIENDRAATYEDPTIVAPEERERAFGQHDHVRLYGRDYLDRLRSVGFAVTEDLFVRELDETTLRRAAPSLESIFVCRRS